jgi:hypothetical protein
VSRRFPYCSRLPSSLASRSAVVTSSSYRTTTLSTLSAPPEIRMRYTPRVTMFPS